MPAFATNHTLLTLAQARAWRRPDITNTLTLYAHVRVINYTLEVNLLWTRHQLHPGLLA